MIALVDGPALTTSELAVATIGLRRANGAGQVWLKQPRWANEAGMSDKTMRKALYGLEAKGIVEVEQLVLVNEEGERRKGVNVVTFLVHPKAKKPSPKYGKGSPTYKQPEPRPEQQARNVAPNPKLGTNGRTRSTLTSSTSTPIDADEGQFFVAALDGLAPVASQRGEWRTAYDENPLGFLREVADAKRYADNPTAFLTERIRAKAHLHENAPGPKKYARRYGRGMTTEEILDKYGGTSKTAKGPSDEVYDDSIDAEAIEEYESGDGVSLSASVALPQRQANDAHADAARSKHAAKGDQA